MAVKTGQFVSMPPGPNLKQLTVNSGPPKGRGTVTSKQWTGKLPKAETFGLSSQMQRAAIAIPSNIAEGAKRGHRLEYIQFLRVARGNSFKL